MIMDNMENAILLGSGLVLWLALLVFLETMPEHTRRKLLESLRAESLRAERLERDAKTRRDTQNESQAG